MTHHEEKRDEPADLSAGVMADYTHHEEEMRRYERRRVRSHRFALITLIVAILATIGCFGLAFLQSDGYGAYVLIMLGAVGIILSILTLMWFQNSEAN